MAAVEPRLVHIRGTLAEEPNIRRPAKNNALVARPHSSWTFAVLDVSAVESGGIWIDASGLTRLTVEGEVTELHVGDEIEVVGWLTLPSAPMNPGGRDYGSQSRDDRTRAELHVRHSPNGVVRLNQSSWGSRRVLASLRGWCQRGINETLSAPESSIATALLLGDNHAMSADEWDRYVRTGVIHVLAISGQHLVILGAFLWFALRLAGVSRRQAAVIVALTLVTYAFMTGGRSSAVRAAVIACSVCGGILLRATPLPANTFSLAWLVVLAFNPTDLFTAGFQLSFLCVAVLIWGIPRWFPPRQLTPLEQLVDESRSTTERVFHRVVSRRRPGVSNHARPRDRDGAAHRLLAEHHVAGGRADRPAGHPLDDNRLDCWLPLVVPLATWPDRDAARLGGRPVDRAVRCARRARGPTAGWVLVCRRLPAWWVIGFYAIGGVWLFVGAAGYAKIGHRHFFPVIVGLWTLLGLAIGLTPSSSDELRVTFLAVDHGSCAVIETPDGRVLLYDAGATAGPDVTKRRHRAILVVARHSPHR